MRKKLFIFGFLIVLLVAIPLTVYIAQKQTQLPSHASQASTLYFQESTTGSEVQAATGETVTLHLRINPNKDNFSNQINIVRFTLSYDSTILATASGACGASICPNQQNFPLVNDPATYTPGQMSVTVSTGTDITRLVKTDTEVATITLKTLAPSQSSVLAFIDPTFAYSVCQRKNANDCQDLYNENVLSQKSPLSIVVTGADPTPTPPLTPTGFTNQPPICTSFTPKQGTDSSTYTFGATGTDPDGTITKVTFNFGDGGDTGVQDDTNATGLNTGSVTAELTHVYSTPGNYTANVTFTDNSGAISNPGNCSYQLAVAGASTPAPTTADSSNNNNAATNVPSTPPGPDNSIATAGIFGAILTIIGGALFFAL